jgi:hypothetical protein
VDAFDRPYWNLLQVVAWIYLRDANFVRAAADDAPHQTHWSEETLPDGRRELIEVDSGPVSTFHLAVAAASGTTFADSYEGAKHELVDALQQEQLIAQGVPNNVGDLTPIPGIQWSDLEFAFEPELARRKPQRGARAPASLSATVWYHLRFPSVQVVKLWPDSEALAAVLEEEPNYADFESHSPTWMSLQEQICYAIGCFPDYDKRTKWTSEQSAAFERLKGMAQAAIADEKLPYKTAVIDGEPLVQKHIFFAWVRAQGIGLSDSYLALSGRLFAGDPLSESAGNTQALRGNGAKNDARSRSSQRLDALAEVVHRTYLALRSVETPNPQNRDVFRNLKDFDTDGVILNVEIDSRKVRDWTVTWEPWGGKQEPRTTNYQNFRKRMSGLRKRK